MDVNRNAYAQHAVAPYGVRAKPRAPVAVPIHWEELTDPKLKPDRWTVKTIGDRIDSEGDPWKGMSAEGAEAAGLAPDARPDGEAHGAPGAVLRGDLHPHPPADQPAAHRQAARGERELGACPRARASTRRTRPRLILTRSFAFALALPAAGGRSRPWAG